MWGERFKLTDVLVVTLNELHDELQLVKEIWGPGTLCPPGNVSLLDLQGGTEGPAWPSVVVAAGCLVSCVSR
jgi:hypothetical protein